MDTEKQRQSRHDNVIQNESRNTRSEQLLIKATESLTNKNGCQEWIGMSKAPADF